MNYELAKALKNAGFFQKQTGDYYALNGQYTYPLVPTQGNYEKVSIPTLSELIEACGDRFGKLIRRPNSPNYEGDSARWGALEVSGVGITIIREGWGYAPEEAVANLWIALHEKNQYITVVPHQSVDCKNVGYSCHKEGEYIA